MYKKLQKSIDRLITLQIPAGRKSTLQELAKAIQVKIEKNEAISLNFICTHNSRRSHLGQIWAQVAAAHFGINSVHCYSGGTEATAMYPSIVKALTSQGIEVTAISGGANPIYAVKYAPTASPVICFSKKYDHFYNPTAEYIAVLTCSHADENCPVITGADQRIAITYLDPKVSDGSTLELEKYLERSEQIASEMFYAFSLVVQV